MMKRCQRVKPALVAQIKFTEWTRDDQFRSASLVRFYWPQSVCL
jgi:ATP-dependent DNA ligase